MNISSLSSTAQTALNGLGRVVEQVEDVARNVAAVNSDVQGSGFSGALSQMARLPELHMQARADGLVFSRTEELFAELASMPRL